MDTTQLTNLGWTRYGPRVHPADTSVGVSAAERHLIINYFWQLIVLFILRAFTWCWEQWPNRESRIRDTKSGLSVFTDIVSLKILRADSTCLDNVFIAETTLLTVVLQFVNEN